MKVSEIMVRTPETCHPETPLNEVAYILWNRDCGVVPVVDENNKVCGLITDRDICIAVATKNRLAREIRVDEVISNKVYSCFPEADARSALQIMRDHQCRRLPVVDRSGILQGIVSLNDIILAVKNGAQGKKTEPTYADVVETLKGICAHEHAAAAA